MIIEVKVPSPGESIAEVQLASWLIADGDLVERDLEIAEVDSDKATLTINAPEGGVIKLMVNEGDTIAVGTVIATINTESKASESQSINVSSSENADKSNSLKNKPEQVIGTIESADVKKDSVRENPITPLARKVMEEKNLSDAAVRSHASGKRINKADVEAIVSSNSVSQNISQASQTQSSQTQSSQNQTSQTQSSHTQASHNQESHNQESYNQSSQAQNRYDISTKQEDNATKQKVSRKTERKKLTMLRQKLSERLVSVKNETAMLTTFNEVNMSAIMALKQKHNDKFKEKYGISIGFMSLFTKAVTIALRQFPQVNAIIDGDEIISHDYVDVSIAVSSPKGLVVPVIRNTESLSIAEIELKIKELATKARNNKISLDEMTGGTFTISNGGVFGSMLSTPILNPPQSAILGMHNIQERPIALDGQVVIAPMMYLALSYDHRVIDGRESVSFLVKVKQLLEQPEIMFYDGIDPIKGLLGL